MFLRLAAVSTLLLLLAVPACESPEGELESDPAVPGAADTTPGTSGVAAESALTAVYDFHDALARADSMAALALLDPDARIYESGHAETVAEYRDGHLSADIEFASAVEREIVSEELVPLGEGYLYIAETRASGSFRGREVDSAGLETVVLVPEDGDWFLRHIHWSSR